MSEHPKSHHPVEIFTPADGSPPRYEVVCPECHADLSTVSLGSVHYTVLGPVVDVYYPLRCPECKAWLLLVPERPKVLPAGGRTS